MANRSVGFLGLLIAPALLADTATLTWGNPTQYTDGAALDQGIAATNLKCTALVISTTRNTCPLVDQIVAGTAMTYLWTYTITSSSNGNICFAAQTKLADGSISDWSVEGCKAFAATRKPKPPVLTVK